MIVSFHVRERYGEGKFSMIENAAKLSTHPIGF